MLKSSDSLSFVLCRTVSCLPSSLTLFTLQQHQPHQQPPKRADAEPAPSSAASLARSKQSKDEANVLEEIRVNNLFETQLRTQLEELQKPNELRKFANYVSEVDDIAALVVNLSLRIGRTTAMLNGIAEGTAAHKVLHMHICIRT